MLSWAQRGGCCSVDDDPAVGPSKEKGQQKENKKIPPLPHALMDA